MSIKPYKNDGSSENEPDLFRVRWDLEKGMIVKDPNGPWWGYLDKETKQVIRKKQNLGVSLTVEKPSIGVIEGEE
jgi:hypothetical protein